MLIARPEETYRVVCVFDRETSIMKGPFPTRGCCAMEKYRPTFKDFKENTYRMLNERSPNCFHNKFE